VKEGVFVATLDTKGRKTGREHRVLLRAVSYKGRLYFSRRNQNADWLKNAIANPCVRVELDGATHKGMALLVTDQTLAKKISELKYTDKQRAKESRIVLEVTLGKTSLVEHHISDT
jgi:hypothetical protein